MAVASQILLPDENERMHSKIIAHRKVIAEWKKQENRNANDKWRPRNTPAPPFLANTISNTSIPRACRIIDALIKAMEPLGCKLTDNLEFAVNGETVCVSFSESQDKINHIPTKEENRQLLEYEEKRRKYSYASRPQISKYDYQYNGRLCLKINNQKSFRDCKAYQLEDRLGDMMLELYLDVYLKWYEDSRPVTKSFITGKTLGETGADLDRMFLISSAITKAFHGDGETYARHLRQGERAEPEGMIVHLNPTEQRTIIEALVEQQERQEQAMSQTEQLLRRMTGSITAYMDEVGRYPLHISDYDKTVLAIRDGEFDAFKNLYPRVSDQTDDLLIEVAGRPGVVGGNMTLILLAAVERFSPEAYLTACKRAVETGDSWRVQTLVKESEGRLSEPLPSLHGEVILYAYTNNCRNIAKDLIAQCTPEQIASVPPKLLRWVAEKLDFQTAVDLVDKGVRPGDEVAGILRTLTGQHQEWMAERLLEHGMPVEPDNYDALYACVSNQAVGAAKLLLDRGIDLEQYQLWAEHRPKGDGYTETMEELAAYWSELQNSTQPEDSPMKGMNL